MAAPQHRAGSLRSRCGRARLELSAVAVCFALLGLTGCASTESPASGAAVGNVPLECAPFARAVSGVQLRGVAADWWPQAEGRYHRTQTPAAGSVLVFRRSTCLPDGHVAVVSRVLSDRRTLATHANWVRHQVSGDVPVIDVSPGNDWTKSPGVVAANQSDGRHRICDLRIYRGEEPARARPDLGQCAAAHQHRNR